MRTAELMEKIEAGQGSADDIALLEKLGRVMSYSCLCGLGQAAPTPILRHYQAFQSRLHCQIIVGEQRRKKEW